MNVARAYQRATRRDGRGNSALNADKVEVGGRKKLVKVEHLSRIAIVPHSNAAIAPNLDGGVRQAPSPPLVKQLKKAAL